MTELIPITQAQLKEMRAEQFRKQECKCAILGIPIEEDECVFDHKHKLKNEECGGPNGLGCLRGVIHHNVNVFEGKLERLWKRYGLSKVISLPDLLRRCADYIECPPMKPEYIHPNEKPKTKDLYAKLSKTEYKRVCKYFFVMFPRKRILPKYTKYKKGVWIEWAKQASHINKMGVKTFTEDEKEAIKRAQELIKKDVPVKIKLERRGIQVEK